MSILTYQYRIKDSTARQHLVRMAYAVNTVWNYCNDVSMLVWRSRKRSLGWGPFKSRYIRLAGDCLTYCGHTFRVWLSRPLAGQVKTGSFSQDVRGHWYVNLQCGVTDRPELLGHAEIGVDLGLSQQLACSDGVVYSRANLTRQYEEALATAQRAKKKKRVTALHAKIKNVRKDWTHKATTAIARRARLIVVGNVSSAKLTQTPFAKSTYDAAWGMVRQQLHYKAIGLLVSASQVVKCSPA